MKIATLVVRLLFGLLLLFASISFFVMTPPEIPEGKMKIFSEGMAATGYLMMLVKVTELLCGLAFVIGRFVPLANLAILPISINICLIHIFMEPSGMPMGFAVLAANIFLIYAYWEHYKTVVVAK